MEAGIAALFSILLAAGRWFLSWPLGPDCICGQKRVPNGRWRERISPIGRSVAGKGGGGIAKAAAACFQVLQAY
jgi:hypothetical protein